MENNCQTNESLFERFLRTLLGLGLLALVPETEWGYFGFIPLITGVAGVCPMYSLLGINSCKTSKNQTSASNPTN